MNKSIPILILTQNDFKSQLSNKISVKKIKFSSQRNLI